MFLDSTSIVLPGSNRAIPQTELRELQVSLCQHAPAVTKGVDEIHPLPMLYFVADTILRFKDPNELLCHGAPLPSYRQMIAHFGQINEQLAAGAGDSVPELFRKDCDIVTAVQLKDTIEWLHVAVTGGFVSFTCLGHSTRMFEPGMALLLSA